MNVSQLPEVETARDPTSVHYLKARRLGIRTHQEAVVYMRTDCHVCRSEGLTPQSRVLLRNGRHEIIATLHQVASDLLETDEAGLSEIAWERLAVKEGDLLDASHPQLVESLRSMRSRIYGHRLDQQALLQIVGDIVEGQYSDVELSAFITACAALPFDDQETVALTKAMVDVGERLSWAGAPILDKHSVGGLPGNRTTPIVVSIVAVHELTMPKTSSRAITSPAGTADTMETLAPVDLDLPSIRRVVEQEYGCIVWGGSVRLSPADDILIRIERALDVDSEGQLVASVLSKKIAAGSSHLVLDMPVGPTAKVRSAESAQVLSQRLIDIANLFGLKARVILSDGLQPVGRGIGPALEARDVLAVLQNASSASAMLRDRACICEAQGGMRVPTIAKHQHPLLAAAPGRIKSIDNRKIARLAKLAGAPEAKAAGLELYIQLDQRVSAGEPLCSVHAETPGELRYALDFACANPRIIEVGPE